MKRPLTLFFIHGKISKKSKIVYRVCNNRQQCYTLNHSTPNSEKQLQQQKIFGLTNKIINKELANPEQKTYWQNIAALSNIKGNTERKAAYAHYSQLIEAQQTIAAQTQQMQQIPTTYSTPTTTLTIQQTNPTNQIAQHTQPIHPAQDKTHHQTKLNNEQFKTLTLITHLMLCHYKTEHYIS